MEKNKENNHKLNNLISALTSNYNVKIKYKNESLLMKLLGHILFFNPRFLNEYSTTIGNTIYFPSKNKVNKYSEVYLSLTLHEFQHIKDSNNINSFLYSTMYLFPQILFLLIIPLYFIIGWWALLSVVFLAPIPAPFRSKIELRGYKVSLFTIAVILKENGYKGLELEEKLYSFANDFNEKFCNSSYYFMKPSGVKKELMEFINVLLKSPDIYKITEIDKDIRKLTKQFLS